MMLLKEVKFLLLLLAAAMVSFHGCSALKARVVNDSSTVMHAITPRYEFARETFEVEGYLYVPEDDEMLSCQLHQQHGHNQIIMLMVSKMTECPLWTWIGECRAKDCVGIVKVWDVDSAISSLDAQCRAQFSFNEPLESDLPIVSMSGQDDEAIWILEKLDQHLMVHVAMDANDPNQAQIALQTWHSKLCCGFILLLSSIANIVIAGLKLKLHVSTARGNPHYHVPPAVVWVLAPEILANFCRAYVALSLYICDGQLLSYEQTKLMAKISVAFSIGTTAALSLIVFHYLRKASGKEEQEKGRKLVIAFAASTAVLVTADVFIALYVGLIHHVEIVRTTISTRYYTFVQFPVSIAFIKFKGKMAKILNDPSVKDTLREDERKRRDSFSKLVKASGVAMLFGNACMFLFAASTLSNSASKLLWGMGGMFLSYGLTSTLQILSIRAPPQTRSSTPVAVVPLAGSKGNKNTPASATPH